MQTHIHVQLPSPVAPIKVSGKLLVHVPPAPPAETALYPVSRAKSTCILNEYLCRTHFNHHPNNTYRSVWVRYGFGVVFFSSVFFLLLSEYACPSMGRPPIPMAVTNSPVGYISLHIGPSCLDILFKLQKHYRNL